MKKFLILLVCVAAMTSRAAFTEFYCQSTGFNTNSGSTTSATATYSSVNGNFDGTSVFTPTDGSTPASKVSVGDWAALYNDGASTAAAIARVTAVAAGANGAITVSTIAKAGTVPTSSATGRSISIGGAWRGPNGATSFPFNIAAGTLTNASGNAPRINMKNTATYSITAGITYATADNLTVLTVQGYASSPGDFGKCKWDGGTSGASYNMLNVSGKNTLWADIDYGNNGATGTADLVTSSGTENQWIRCVFHDCRGNGIFLASGPATVTACEAYNCNQANATGTGGFMLQASGITAAYCIAHHITTASSRGVGFELDGGINLIRCISAFNDYGGRSTADVKQELMNCDFYRNTVDGMAFQQGGTDPLDLSVINCNFLRNGGWGINFGGPYAIGNIINCGFGSGSHANTSGDIHSIGGVHILGSVTYASGVTPWNAPDTGDFSIVLAAAKGTGFGTFTQTYTTSTWTGTAGSPDIGAAQHLGGGSAGGGNYPFSQ